MEPRSPYNQMPFDIQPDKIKPLLIAVAVIALLVGAALTSYYTVAPEGMSVVKRFGKVVGLPKTPGLHFKLPFGIDKDYFVETERIQKEVFGGVTETSSFGVSKNRSLEESLMLTGDLNVIEVKWVVQYKILDPDAWLHQVNGQIESIRDISEAVMRRVVGNKVSSLVLTSDRNEVAQTVREEMQRILHSDDPESYNMGVDIIAIELQDVTPPDAVKPSYNDVNMARAEQEQLINEADRERKEKILTAEGEANRMISEAEGYSASATNVAVGAVARFQAIYDEYKASPEVTRQRMYLEAVGTAIEQAGQVIMTNEGGANPLPLLNLGPKGGAK